MRKLTSLVAALLLSVAAFAQAPQGFSYQAVVRDAQNAIVANQTVDVTLTLKAEIKSIPVQTYTEKHSVKTNANGLLTLVVGQGESSQKFSDFKWNLPEAIYNLETITPYGTGTTQLLSVPYALYAEQAGDIDYAKLIQNLSESDLSTILGLTEYLKKTDIQSQLVGYAKLTDIPASVNLSGYAKKDTLNNFAQKASLASDYVTKETFENYVLSGGNPDSVDLTVFTKTAKLNDTLAAYAKTADIETAYAKKTDLSDYAQKDTLDNFALKTSLASDYVTKETFENYVLTGGDANAVDLTVYATTAKLNDTLAVYATKTEVAGKQDAITDLAEIRSGATLGATALQSHQSLAAYATTAKLNDTLAVYATLTQLQDQISALQTALQQLQAAIPTIEMSKLKIQIVNPYAGNSSSWGYNTATVQFNGETFTSGTKEFDVQVGSAMPLSVSLGTFKQTKTNYSPYEYTYTITVNGQPFDNVAGTYDRPTGYVYNTMRTVSLTELKAKGMIEGGNKKLSDISVGYSWLNNLSSNNEDEIKEQETDTYYNRTAQQNEYYIYADIVDAIPDYSVNNHEPFNATLGRNGGIYNDFDKKTYYCNDYRAENKYFENRLLLGITSENSNYGSAAYRVDAGMRFVGITEAKYYNFDTKQWSNTSDGYVHTLGLTHMNEYWLDDNYYAPIYAKVPNFVYKMEYEQGEILKVGTLKNTLNANMNSQNIGPFISGENTIVITITRQGGSQIYN